MKKFYFIVALLIALNSFSQECSPPTLQTEVATGDCPFTGQVTTFVGITDFGDGTSATIIVHNSINTQNEEIPISELNVFFPTLSYPVGTVLEISAINNQTQCSSPPFELTIPSCSSLDLDKDGYNADVDCDDSRSAINPGATEVCDGKDNNCDGNIDEGVNYTFYRDLDGDGYGDPEAPVYSCNPEPTGFLVTDNTDCDDTNEFINPGADEICGDGKDNNCNQSTDENCGCPDADNDTVCDADDVCPGANDLLDSDNDGTPDCLDNCPNDANKTEPGACGCDNVETDTDSDGTPDCNDACPNDPNKIIAGDCGCGVADTDSDNDGTPDCNDACPNDPNKIDQGDCGCGVADSDSDNDGTPNCNDACPNDPNKITPGDCGCGVADTDTDNDGTPDCIDNCPNDSNKTETGACGCGIADTDSDSDGILDCNDACPNDPTNTCNNCPDADNDTVCDADDICPGSDDLIDADADGTPDGCDACPNDPNKIAPGVCGCGVADTDTDDDGTPDCNDACPNDPSKIAPGDCGCGVADTDSDNDGILDCNDNEINSPCPNNVDANGVSMDTDRDGTPDCLDNCPNDRNKTEPGLCGCGTADADKDADGVPDCEDVCPRGPDTDSDNDGVPDCIDICEGEDDTIDTDGDGLPDCVDSCPDDATNTCLLNGCRPGYFEICHVKKNGDATTLCVTPAQWERHKTHPGDVLGACLSPAAKIAPNNKTETKENSQLNIYPNPLNSNGLWIKFSARENTGNFTAIIYDLNGRILAKKVFESNYKTDRYSWEFNNTSLDDGVFLLKIEDGAQTYYKRILKLKN